MSSASGTRRAALPRRVMRAHMSVALVTLGVGIAVGCGGSTPQPSTGATHSPQPAPTVLAQPTLPPVPPAGAATPKYVGSTSGTHQVGDFGYLTGVFESGLCHIECTYRVVTTLPPDYDQAEILLTGWDVYNLGTVTTMRALDVSSVATAYDPATGAFEWNAAAELRSQQQAGDEFSFKLYFTIALMRSPGGRFQLITNSCEAAAGGACSASTVSANLIGADQEVGAVGVRRFRVESPSTASSTGLRVSRISVDASQWQATGSDLTSVIACVMRDATPTEEMSCGAETLAMIVDPNAATGTQYQGRNYGSAFLSINSTEPAPPGKVMDAFGGLTGFDTNFSSGSEALTWHWAANYADILICPGKMAFCDVRLGFLGDNMRQPNTHPFEIDNKGFALWIR